jgi:hypothetical protein
VCAHTHVFATCRTLYTVHCTACTTCRTLYTVQPALLVGHCTLYTVQPCRCYTLPLYSPVSQYTVHYKYTQYSVLQVYAVQCTASIRSTVYYKYTQYSVLQVYAVQCTASIRSGGEPASGTRTRSIIVHMLLTLRSFLALRDQALLVLQQRSPEHRGAAVALCPPIDIYFIYRYLLYRCSSAVQDTMVPCSRSALLVLRDTHVLVCAPAGSGAGAAERGGSRMASWQREA